MLSVPSVQLRSVGLEGPDHRPLVTRVFMPVSIEPPTRRRPGRNTLDLYPLKYALPTITSRHIARFQETAWSISPIAPDFGVTYVARKPALDGINQAASGDPRWRSALRPVMGWKQPHPQAHLWSLVVSRRSRRGPASASAYSASYPLTALESVYLSRTASRPRDPSRSRSAWSSIRRITTVRSSSSSGTTNPVRPGSMCSTTPPPSSNTIVGTPTAIASTAALPN